MIEPPPRTRWLFLSDAPPCPGAAGCHFVSRNLCSAFSKREAVLVTRRFARRFAPETIHATAEMPTILWTDLTILGLRRPWPALRGLVDQFVFNLQLPGLQRRLRTFNPTRIFALAGADPFFLGVATSLATAMKVPLDLYLVDDFEEGATAGNDTFTIAWIRRNERKLLEAADRLWVISDGLAEHLKRKLGVDSAVLPVAMPPEETAYNREPDDGLRRIAFVGSINHLYLDALVSVYRCLSRLNADTPGSPYRLVIFTLRFPKNLVDALGESDYLEIHLQKSDPVVKTALQQSHAVLLPYSFNESSRIMVSTSFSCKTGEALAAGRPVLVFGPPYASVPRHFLKHGLPIVVTCETLLRRAILDIPSFDNASLIERYRTLTEDQHHPEAVLRRLEASNS